ncbi:MAG: polysaccharide biosynthesis protein [Anaerolineae bacterium]|nr:MAG: polysaccharide biosynthesis protein [Anaerolineae bacterium]
MKATKLPIIVRNRYFVISDLLLAALSAVLGFAIRLDVPLFRVYLPVCISFVLMAMAVKLPVFYAFGLYRRYWRYASVQEMVTIFGATTVSSAILALLVLGLFLPLGWFDSFPRSALIIDWLWSLFFIGGIRFSVRFLGEFGTIKDGDRHASQKGKPRHVLIVGAGDAGAMIVREMRNNPGVGMEPVGYVDDNPAKVGMRIRGLPVLGTRDSIPELVRQLRIDEVLIAMPTAPGQAIRQIKDICESVPVVFKTIPGMYELLNDAIGVSQIRDVQIEDLLRRDPIHIQADDAPYLHNKVALVTGAGGSIGSELCRQVARRHPRHLVLLGHGENSIYLIHEELCSQFPHLKLTPVIADVRDHDRLGRVFQAHCPQVIFHAAAHKHVPLMERNLEEAVTNNVLGTRNVLAVAERLGVERFVLISSDKAVNPINIMGATKRITELMVQDVARRTGHNFAAVRFGNVLGSRGSVVPLFKRQIAAGGPVTVTHPDMERYFMTIPEAVYLVLQAATLGRGGELFVLDMGEPVKIVDLARDLVALSGLRPDKDIEIKFIGVRSGEKLQERLFLEGEDYETTQHEKVFVFKGQLSLEGEMLHRAVQRLICLAQQGGSLAEIWSAVKAIVPECAVDLEPPRVTGEHEPRPALDQRIPVASA